MNKRANVAKDASGTVDKRSGISRPEKGKSAKAPIKNGPVAPRASDLKLLSEELLETLIGAVKASAGIVRILPDHGQTQQVISAIGLPAGLLVGGSESGFECDACTKEAIGNGVFVADISACKADKDCSYADSGFQSMIVASLESDMPPEDSIGTITLFFEYPPESIEQAAKNVHAFAHLLGALIEHNRSNREAKRADLIAERHAIANEIHDSLAQTLVYARMRNNLLIEAIRTCNELVAAKYANEIDEALEAGQKAVRELITDFRCEMDPSGLLHAIQALTRQFSERNDIALEYINRVADLDLPLEHEIQIYHIVREALANIATHSGASHARLIIDAIGDKYVFTIEDNGRGGCTFTPVEGHYGMMIMRERAARINGEIVIESREGMGTSVQLSFQDAAVREERD